MANKSLVIDVKDGQCPSGDLNEWKILGNAGTFIQDIITPELSEDADTGTLVSGIPTAFARVDLFNSAFNSKLSNDKPSLARNLTKYYDDLIDEWRGFIACLALDYSNLRVSRIDLEYSDGKPIDQTVNIYEPAGAFGNMLLERRGRWCEQGLADNEKAVPYLNIIKYGGTVVGATSPETLLFTSSDYKIEKGEGKPWVSIGRQKFIDPLKSDLQEKDLKTLYAYVSHILKQLDTVDLGGVPVHTNLEKWQREMEEYARTHDYKIKGGTIPPVSLGFTGPFADLFNFQQILYGVEGVITEIEGKTGAMKFDPRDLLLPASAKIARIYLGSELSKNPEKLKDLPVFVLTASKKGAENEKVFFALPLSTEGLNVYGKSVGALVGVSIDGQTVESKLTAVYDPDLDENNLEVELTIRSDTNNIYRCSQTYTVGNDDRMLNKDILLWPNFVSKQWNQYYLYSELPHNTTAQGYAAYPFVGDISDDYFRILTDEDKQPIYLADDGKITAPREKVEADLLVKSGHEVAENAYKYEIYRSDKPFKGVRLKAPSGEDGGYLIINYSMDPKTKLPRNQLKHVNSLKEVTVGIDFGSTNTSIAYSDKDGDPEGFEFTNKRVSLLGQNRQGGNNGTQENRILFFQAPEKPVKSNAIHSVLTIHNERRLGEVRGTKDAISKLGVEVMGGFPCFLDNLPVSHVSDEIITLHYKKIGHVEQIHNMKWSEQQKDKNRKAAYLKTLLLHIYAEMFDKDRVPVRLRWSYPSSMSNQLMDQYGTVWNSLANINPVSDTEGNPVKLIVSKYMAKTMRGNNYYTNNIPKTGNYGYGSYNGYQGANGGYGGYPGGQPGGYPGGQQAVYPGGTAYGQGGNPYGQGGNPYGQGGYPGAQGGYPPQGGPDLMRMQQDLMNQVQQKMQMQNQWRMMLNPTVPPEMQAQINMQIDNLQKDIDQLMQQQMLLQQQMQQQQQPPVTQQPGQPQQQQPWQQGQQPQQWQQQQPWQQGQQPWQGQQPQQWQQGQQPWQQGQQPQQPQAEEKEYDPMAPDDPNRIVRYKPVKLTGIDNTDAKNGYNSLTEANSVANFMAKELGENRDQLILCFDIGGSTTDISALYKLNTGITMVKQNSLRFAAQRVSEAAKSVKSFKKLLNKVCEEFELSILGLNTGEKNYTDEMAAYYFNQIVDLLTDDQLPMFYSMISAECPELMWVNMYVTGLLLYYGGQITAKLLEDIKRLDRSEQLPGEQLLPDVIIRFAGKGSRIFQWLTTTHNDVAMQYYKELFFRGYGDKDNELIPYYQSLNPYSRRAPRPIYERLTLDLPRLDNSKFIKYEVSQGLAKNNSSLCNPEDDTPSEIIGESGFTVIDREGTSHDLSPLNSISAEMIENIGDAFYPTRESGEKFREFCQVFDDFSRHLFNVKIPKSIFDSVGNLNITQYVQSTPEFFRAKNEKKEKDSKFDFVAPIIILEGMKFYDDYLLKALK